MSVHNRDASAQTHIIELSEFQHQSGGASGAATALGGNLHLLDSVPVKLTVAVGNVETTVAELLALKEASVLKIDRAADTPVDLLLNGNVVARGQLVAVDDNFGIRITEVAAKA
ncbi:FliM/FliN family flagellar motor switch protein [[Empedobacter] haloabium]|uniref:Flagellar motor switch protein FliN n=1 Tax=[Empedobacter] haloabium TaxID=592317 RepID=A0ABZ1UI70_9BURK